MVPVCFAGRLLRFGMAFSLLDEIVLNLHLQGRINAGKSVDHDADEGAIAQAGGAMVDIINANVMYVSTIRAFKVLVNAIGIRPNTTQLAEADVPRTSLTGHNLPLTRARFRASHWHATHVTP